MGTKARTGKTDPAEYKRYLESRLSQTRARIKMADAVTGITIVIVAWVSYLLVAVMADQIIELSVTIRFLLLSACLLATGSVLVLKVILPSLKQVNTRFAARSIESADQRMKNSVLSYVELSEQSGDLPAPILRTIENKAATDLSRVRIEDAIQPRHVLSAVYFMAGIVVLFCLYSFFTTKSFGASIERVLLPLGTTAPPTATQLRIIFDPGENDPTEPTPIPADSSITFKASVTRGNPNQVMAYLQAEGSDYEEPHELARSESLKSEFTLTLHQRQKTFNVRFVADDFRSKQYKIVVTPAPMITEWLLRYTPPAYTGEEAFTATTSDITGLEGTEVIVQATTNLPIAATSGRIEFKLAKPTASVDMKLVDGAENKISGQFNLSGDGSYSVLFSDREGRTPLFRPSNNIRVLKDLAPVVEFIQPAEKDSSLPANRPLLLAARVKDDYGLRGYTLTIRKRGSEESPIVFEQGNLPGVSLQRNESIRETIDLSRWKLGDGDVVEYWIEAEDNKLPASNITDTRKESRLVRITKPIEDQPVAKNDQQQNPSDESKPTPEGERKENTPSSEVASTDKDQNSADANAREDGPKSDAARESDKNGPRSEHGKSSDPNGEPKKNGPEQEKGANQEQDALRKEMQRGKGSGDADRKQAESNSRDPSSKGDGSSKADGKQNSADEKDLEKLREYFKKESEKNSEGKEGESNSSSNGSSNRDNESSSPTSKDTSKEGMTENKEKSSGSPSESSESGAEARSDSGRDNNKSPNDNQRKQGDSNAATGEKTEGSSKTPSGNPDNKKGDEAGKQGDAKENSTPHPNDNAVKRDESSKSGTGEGKSSEKNQSDSATGSSKQDAAEKKESPETGEKKEAPTNEKTPNSSEQNSEPKGKGDDSTEKKADSSEPTQTSPAKKPDSTTKNREESSEEHEKSSEPKTGRQANDQSQQKSGGNNSKNSSQESGNNSSSKDKPPKSSESATPQNSQEQKPDGNDQPKSGDQNQTKAGSEAKPNANGEQQSSGGEKQSGQESQSQAGDSGSSSKSSEEGKQNKESREGKPTSASDDSSQSPNRSTKMGNNESSAASKGNSDGSSQEGPSQSPGQKGPGSPSDQKGNESKGSGNEQRTPGEKGTPSEKKSSEGDKQSESSSPKNDSSKSPSSNENTGEKSNPSQRDKSSEQSPSQEQGKSSEQGQSSSQQGKESSSSQGSPTSGGDQQSSKSNGDKSKDRGKGQQQPSGPSSNSSESSSPMNETPSDDSTSAPPKNQKEEESKKSGQGSSGSSNDQNKEQQNASPPKASSSSGNQQSQDATPSSNSNAGGANDVQSNSPTSKPQGGNKPNPSNNTKGEGNPIDNTGEAANQDDLKKGSNLILKKLEEQLANKKVDPDLLKSMGWTEDDARKFYERMKSEKPAENVSPLGQEQRRQFGQGTDLRKSTGKSAGKTNDSIQDLYSGKRTPVPPQVRKRFEAYMKSLSETSSAKPAEKAPAPPAGTK